MVQSNEFKGATLSDVVRAATRAYGARCEFKNQGRCNDLILEINRLSLSNVSACASDLGLC